MKAVKEIQINVFLPACQDPEKAKLAEELKID